MSKHPIRNFFGLIVLYTAIILGIFLLQFRSESVFSTSFGQLRLQLAETQNEKQEKLLKNQFQLSFQGLIISADNSNPVRVIYKDGTQTDAILSNWQKTSDLGCTLEFSDQLMLSVSVSDATQDATFLISAQLPDGAESVSIPYKPAGGYLVTEQNERRTIISSKNAHYRATAADISSDRLYLTPKNQNISYNVFDPSSIFEFGSVHGIAKATKESYNQTIQQFKTNFTQLFSRSITDSLAEQTVVAYIAAMAENKAYASAINQIPASIKTSSRRTYLSAPFFNSLVAMNNSLVMYIDNHKNMINYALTQKSFDIFNLSNLAELLCITDSNIAKQLLSMPASFDSFEPTPSQAAGIINTYTKLQTIDKGLAQLLVPVLEVCLNSIATACSIDGENLIISVNENPLTTSEMVFIGTALIKYGHFTDNLDYSATGYFAVNSAIADNISLHSDLRAMGELYPVLVPDNKFYPHIEIIATSANSGTGKTLWAWTSAQKITSSRDTIGNLTLSIVFPQDWTQYIIFNGIDSFRRIDIYDMAFRTDPRFETYESSGYVFHSNTGTLFLKSLHHATTENVKLYYTIPAPTSEATEATESEDEVADSVDETTETE